MAVDVIMPNLGLTMEEGTVARWLVAEGQRVARGQPLLEVETDKVTVEVESPGAGIMGALDVGEGQRVPVGTVLARIYREDEPGRARPADEAVVPVRQGRTPDVTGPGVPVARARTPADTGLRPGERIFSSPRARTRARLLALDWRAVRGSGPGGRVVERDVLAAATGVMAGVAEPGPVGTSFLTAQVELQSLLEAHGRLQDAAARQGRPAITLADWLLLVAAAVLRRQEIRGVEMGLAVLGPAGTVVPVAGVMQARGLVDVATQRRQVIEEARWNADGALPGAWVIVHDLSRSVAQVYGSAPPWPRSAMVTLGGIRAGQHASSSVVSLTWDGRVWSLEVALGFLEEVVALLEEPFELL